MHVLQIEKSIVIVILGSINQLVFHILNRKTDTARIQPDTLWTSSGYFYKIFYLKF